MEEEGTQNLKLLKIVVITLGILIVIMLGVMVGTVIYRMSGSGGETADAAPATMSPELGIPVGGGLKSMTPGNRELYLHVEDETGADHIYALDRKTGALKWRRQLTPAQ